MSDALADSTERLKRLLEKITTEKDPDKTDELAAEIWRILEAREGIKSALDVQKKLEQRTRSPGRDDKLEM